MAKYHTRQNFSLFLSRQTLLVHSSLHLSTFISVIYIHFTNLYPTIKSFLLLPFNCFLFLLTLTEQREAWPSRISMVTSLCGRQTCFRCLTSTPMLDLACRSTSKNRCIISARLASRQLFFILLAKVRRKRS